MSGVTYHIRAVRCDIHGCDAEREGMPGEYLDQVRRAAASEGWHRAGKWDFCPDHNGSRAAVRATTDENEES